MNIKATISLSTDINNETNTLATIKISFKQENVTYNSQWLRSETTQKNKRMVHVKYSYLDQVYDLYVPLA